MRVEERLLKYVSYWTTSDEECRQIPSSERQFELGKVLEQELRDLGLEKVTLTDHCYVYGLLPATKGYADKPAVGFISHMDTAPDFSGKDVKPQIIPDYDGNDVLLKGSGAYLKISDFPTLKTLKGRTLITTDGTTLLGADDKAGVSHQYLLAVCMALFCMETNTAQLVCSAERHPSVCLHSYRGNGGYLLYHYRLCQSVFINGKQNDHSRHTLHSHPVVERLRHF